MKKEPIFKQLKSHSDERGSFAELIRKEDLNKPTFGQVSITTATPGQAKGEHYHKIRYEWFIVIQGKVTFILKNLKTQKKVKRSVSSENLTSVCIPPYWIHTFKNNSKEDAIVVLYSSIPFDPKRPDTYPLTFSR